MYIGITGTLGSGKGEAAKVLRKHGFKHYGFGELLRAEQTRQGLDTSVATTTNFANNLRKERGPAVLAELLLREMERDLPKNAVFESIRTLAELQLLRKLPGFILIAIDAPRETRWERVKSRNRDNLKNFEEFCYWEDKQLEGNAHEQQLLAVMEEADVRIMNIGELEELEEQLRETLNI